MTWFMVKAFQFLTSPGLAVGGMTLAVAMERKIAANAGEQSLLTTLMSYLWAQSLALWMIRDAKRRNIALPYDSDGFVMFLPAVAVPVYLFSTRGWWAFLIIGGYAVFYVLTGIMAFLLMWLGGL